MKKELSPICKCGRKMIKNTGNIDMWICPSRNEKFETIPHQPKSLKLYHGTQKNKVKQILKNGLKRVKDRTYIYLTSYKEIAKKYGEVILEVEVAGLDLRVWSKDRADGQIMVMGDIEAARIKRL